MDRTRTSDTRLSLAELTEAANVSVRTVRYYIAEGLLPPPLGSGPASFYTPAHRERLQLIGRLKDAYLPLKEIRRRLAGVEDAELPALLQLSDAELFDPTTWESRIRASTVSSYVERAARQSRNSTPGSMEWRVDSAPSAQRAGAADEPADAGFALDSLGYSVDDVPVTRSVKPEPVESVLARDDGLSMRLPWLAEDRPAQLQDVSANRPEIDRAAGPSWRRISLGEEIELMVSDRAWRRNREKLEWLANWARKVLR
ncbi:MAG: MerR family transcriptional regulator [Thermomicrobiales bacterium]